MSLRFVFPVIFIWRGNDKRGRTDTERIKIYVVVVADAKIVRGGQAQQKAVSTTEQKECGSIGV